MTNLTIISTNRLTKNYHEELGHIFEVEFNDGTFATMYDETFYDQLAWDGKSELIGRTIDLDKAHLTKY